MLRFSVPLGVGVWLSLAGGIGGGTGTVAGMEYERGMLLVLIGCWDSRWDGVAYSAIVLR